MSFDAPTRNRLAKLVGDARALLTNEFFEQCRSVFGIAPSGQMAALEELGDLDDAERATAALLRERVKYLVRTHPDEKEAAPSAATQLVREQAFTVLNRLAALRMAEKRGLIVESVGKGYRSKGFKVFETVAGTGLGDTYRRYRQYLQCLFDELAVDLGVFDRRSPHGLLFPRESALLGCLDLINGPDVEALWAEDETIGWVYQYYNDPAERKKMRDESAAPRDSRELAVRNQFFTPRYVVEFLTDNTLGRIWYEMTSGMTAMTDQCRYLVRRPTEIFLGDPKLAFDRIFGTPEDGEYPSIPAAYQGSLSELPTESSVESRWVSVAIPPGEFPRITGEPYQPFEDDRIGRLLDDILNGRDNQDSRNLVTVWAAISSFTLNDGGGAYSREPWQKLWAHFRELAQHSLTGSGSDEELLHEPAFIPHRPLKDPRELRMLDPACGSMHFGLYAFDLFEAIYDEAWDIAHGTDTAQKASISFSPFVSFVAQYPDKAAFLVDVPRLIVEHNLHGIDIDPRAAQIAGLSLWLRVQRSWQRQAVRPEDRPRIRRSNIVCAEPMPGDAAFLGEFIESHLADTPEGRLLGQLVRRVFDAMQLAGEAGSLLKIEQEIGTAVAEAKQKWLAGPKLEQSRLFADDTAAPVQQKLALDVSGISDDAFWENAEERIYSALQSYSERAEHSGSYQRRLFAEDAARGFAFVDVSRKQYDAVLMNPPFGEGVPSARDYIDAAFPKSKNDIYAAFVDRGAGRLSTDGKLGAITSRNGLFASGLEQWREHFLLGGAFFADTLCDLGHGVLDGALVEAAAYVISPMTVVERNRQSLVFAALDAEDKAARLTSAMRPEVLGSRFVVKPADLQRLPGSPYAYWISSSVAKHIGQLPTLSEQGGMAAVGLQTDDDWRFLRLRWEVDPKWVGRDKVWVPFAKGGEYSPYYDDVHLLIKWVDDGAEVKAFVETKYRQWSRHIQNTRLYFRPGLTYPERTTSDFSPRVLPKGCIFSVTGQGIFFDSDIAAYGFLGFAYTRTCKLLMEVFIGSGDAVHSGSAARHYKCGIVNGLPSPGSACGATLGTLVPEVIALAERRFDVDVTAGTFRGPRLVMPTDSLASAFESQLQRTEDDILRMLNISSELDRQIASEFGFVDEHAHLLDEHVVKHPCSYERQAPIDEEALSSLYGRAIDALVDVATVSTKSRHLSKKSYFADRRIELLSHICLVHPETVIETRRKLRLVDVDEFKDDVIQVVDYLVGSAFGVWNVARLGGQADGPDRGTSFDSLPSCPPGQLQNHQGLPVTKADVLALQSEGRWDYPIEVPWDGILSDDAGHAFDIEARVQQVMQVLWKEQWENIEREACEILGVSTLRDYLRKPGGFFADHLKRYSKSRRQAPIYWPLSTANGGYTLWIYYHRLTDQTVHTALADFVEAKIHATERTLADARAADRRQETDDLADLLLELHELRAELERVIRLPWNPNLNDGVLITASPLWKLFRLPKWQRDLKSCWDELESGECDWAHLALSIWPERVKQACEKDRSVAIAHDFEHLFKGSVPSKKPAKSSRKTLAAESA